VIAAADLLRDDWGVGSRVWSCPSFTELAREAADVERWNLLHPEAAEARKSWVETCLGGGEGGPVVASTDYVRMFADQIRPYVPGRYRVLGTDGFGRSDYRRRLRHFFEVDRRWVVLAALESLAKEGKVPASRVAEAIRKVRDRPGEAEPGQGLSPQETNEDGGGRREGGDRDQGSRHRRLQGRADHRDPREAGRRDQGGRPADLARVRQGDDGRAGVRGRHGRGAAGQDRRQGQRGQPDPAPQGRRRRCPRPAARGGAALRDRPAGADPAAQGAAPPPAPAKPASGAPPVATAPATAARAAAASDPATVHASPGVRRLARELEVDLGKVRGTGEKGRITKEDVRAFLKGPAAPAAAPAGAAGTRRRHGHPGDPGAGLLKFGPVETKPLARIKRISGPFLHRAWLNIPHVTHGDEADITEIEQYRKELDAEAKADKKSPTASPCCPS
jgi:hypothetical protein